MKQKKNLRVLFPIGSFYPAQSGGPNNTIYWHTKALSKKGVECTIVTTNQDLENHKVPFNKWLNRNFGKVIYFTRRNDYLPFRMILTAIGKLRNADIVHLTALFHPPSWIVGTFAWLLGKKIIWSVRGELAPKALSYSSKIKRWVLKWIMVLADKVVFHATSPDEVSCILTTFGKSVKYIHIPNLIEMPKVVEHTPKSPYFLFVGRIHPIKGLENLLSALFDSEMFVDSNFVFKIAGNFENEYGRLLEKMVLDNQMSGKVEFLGLVQGDGKQQLYANAHFLLFPSFSENFGNVVLESLAQGTPVMASKGTPWKILEEKKAGYWVDNSKETLKSTINQILQVTPVEYTEMRKNASVLVKKEFEVDENIDQWIDKYSNM